MLPTAQSCWSVVVSGFKPERAEESWAFRGPEFHKRVWIDVLHGVWMMLLFETAPLSSPRSLPNSPTNSLTFGVDDGIVTQP